MNQPLEYKRLLNPMEQQCARLEYEIGLLEAGIIMLAEDFNPSAHMPSIKKEIDEKNG